MVFVVLGVDDDDDSSVFKERKAKLAKKGKCWAPLYWLYLFVAYHPVILVALAFGLPAVVACDGLMVLTSVAVARALASARY